MIPEEHCGIEGVKKRTNQVMSQVAECRPITGCPTTGLVDGLSRAASFNSLVPTIKATLFYPLSTVLQHVPEKYLQAAAAGSADNA
jgi:hypothetical protein